MSRLDPNQDRAPNRRVPDRSSSPSLAGAGKRAPCRDRPQQPAPPARDRRWCPGARQRRRAGYRRRPCAQSHRCARGAAESRACGRGRSTPAATQHQPGWAVVRPWPHAPPGAVGGAAASEIRRAPHRRPAAHDRAPGAGPSALRRPLRTHPRRQLPVACADLRYRRRRRREPQTRRWQPGQNREPGGWRRSPPRTAARGHR